MALAMQKKGAGVAAPTQGKESYVTNGIIRFNPVFVNTKNVANFRVVMDGLRLAAGEGCLGLIHGQAGRGKTRTAQHWHAANPSVYIRAVTVWRSTELEFLRLLARETGVVSPPGRKGPCFTRVVEALAREPVPVFVDEVEKLPRYFLDLIRDLSDLSTAPFVLIGEQELEECMRRNRRVWSRTFQALQFTPIEMSDCVVYAREAAGLEIPVAAVRVMHQSSSGDFRLVKRILLNLIQILNSDSERTITEEKMKAAIDAGLGGRR